MKKENAPTMTVSEMVKSTGQNTAQFMLQVADHIDTLERRVDELKARITELESAE
jgi:ubiquinone biosynthesis protein UbiJ